MRTTEEAVHKTSLGLYCSTQERADPAPPLMLVSSFFLLVALEFVAL